MSYKIDLGQWGGIFAVPHSVVDNHIKLAGESQLKTLLYLLRYSGEDIDDSRLSKALNISAEEAANSVEFWIERGLIRSDNGALTPKGSEKANLSTVPAVLSEPEPPKKRATAPSRAQRPDPAFVSQRLVEDPLLSGLLEEAERTLKKPLSPGDTATLVMLYDTFGLPCDVIVLLMNALAECYHLGDGCLKNDALAISWWQKAANNTATTVSPN